MSRTSVVPISDVALRPSGAPDEAYLARLAKTTIRGYLINVTPGLAKEWLVANIGNRPIRAGHVQTLGEEMRGGHWKATHQGIAFSQSGRLLDGQHRLAAIIATGWPCEMMVFVNLADDVFGALDRGKRRTHADLLHDDPRIVEPCTWIARVLRYPDRRSPSPSEVADIRDLYMYEAAEVVETVPGTKPVRTAAGVKAAVMVRLHDANAEHRKLLLAQWQALARLETRVIDVTGEALLKRLERLTGSSGTNVEERGAVAWIGFNPHARTLSKIIVRDLGTELGEIRSAVQRHIRDRADPKAQRP
jgi:hypothetical protein